MMDITKLQLSDRHDPVYSFLCLHWGLSSDIDLESEVLRNFGDIRYHIYAFSRVIKKRQYSFDFEYVGKRIENRHECLKVALDRSSTQDNEELKTLYQLEDNKDSQSEDQDLLNSKSDKVWKSLPKNINCLPLSKVDDGYNDIVIQRSDHSRYRLIKLMLNYETGTYFNRDGDVDPTLRLEYYKITEFK